MQGAKEHASAYAQQAEDVRAAWLDSWGTGLPAASCRPAHPPAMGPERGSATHSAALHAALSTPSALCNRPVAHPTRCTRPPPRSVRPSLCVLWLMPPAGVPPPLPTPTLPGVRGHQARHPGHHRNRQGGRRARRPQGRELRHGGLAPQEQGPRRAVAGGRLAAHSRPCAGPPLLPIRTTCLFVRCFSSELNRR